MDARYGATGTGDAEGGMMEAPEFIWLQDDGDYESARPRNSEEEGITWSSDPIGDNDTKYVRADLHANLTRQLAEVTAERDAALGRIRWLEVENADNKDNLKLAYAERDALKADAERMDELQRRYIGCDFNYGADEDKQVLLFTIDGGQVTSDIRKTLDAGREGK